jgi:hypothetical protein
MLSAATVACAPMTVSSHVQSGLDVSRYHTYDWGPADALPASDPRLTNNAFYRDHVQGAIEKQMASRGYTQAPAGGSPDLLIHYHAVVDTRLDVNRVDREHGYCYDESCAARVVEYDQGTLVLDVVDAKTNRVIWRGWAQKTVEGVLNDEARLERQVDDAVTRMFERFPGQTARR